MGAQRLAVKAQRVHGGIHILGIDLSKAFDTIRRDQLMSVLKEVVNEDELRLIQYLLSETKLHVRLGKTSSPTFQTTIGTPQGDSCSVPIVVCHRVTVFWC
eukprot:scpid105894/ scgid23586/ 